jgi:rhodanese-related sulfurtransferase
VHVGGKFLGRWRTLRRLRTARVLPVEVRRRLDAGEPIFIVDLRSDLDFASDPRTLPGAVRVTAEALPARVAEIPRDRDVVLYCT